MNKIRIDYLYNHKDYKVCQHEDMYHFNSDTCLLGEFIKINQNDEVLDIGTNNGALLVYIVKKGGIATGIEINSDAIEICKLTLKENNINATIINQDFLTYKDNKKYDAIVCNPPYFTNSNDNLKSKNKHISLARHDDLLPLDKLCKAIPLHLKENGNLFMVFKANGLELLTKHLNDNGLFINEYQYVFDKNNNKLRSLLIKASFINRDSIKLNDINY